MQRPRNVASLVALLAGLTGLCLGAGPALALDHYGLSARHCKAPPEGVIAVSGSSILITETFYHRISPKRDLGGGWFEATYQIEAEGEPMGTSVLKVRLNAARIELEIDGQRIVMDACP